MVLTDNDIKNFQAIYKEQFGKEISTEDAYEQGIKLLTLMKILRKPTQTNNKTNGGEKDLSLNNYN